jgi:cyclophilin family peptidyl-prolyl cis-trans isomerase
MFPVRLFLPCLFLTGAASALQAQTTVPTLNAALTDHTLVAGSAPAHVNLRAHFTVPGVTGPVVQFDTTKGKFNAELLAADMPKTVVNFLNYTHRGAYTNSFIHRSVSNFVIQGGGYTLSGMAVTPVAVDAPVENEPKRSNTRGTLAMAKTSAGPNTATSQWFVNLNDNSANLDTQNGGFTVFGYVLSTGMSVVDAIAAVPVYNAKTQLGAAFDSLPLLAGSLSPENFLMVKSVGVVPLFPEPASASAVVGFTATSSNPGVATVEIAASTLTIRPVSTGMATVTVRAQDTNGKDVSSSFLATVVATPSFTLQPASQSVGAGANASLSVAASGSPAFQWQHNGRAIAVNSPTLSLSNMQPSSAGLYTAVATSSGASSTSTPAILGVSTTSKVLGSGEEVGPNTPHPSGKRYDQVLLKGNAAAVTADFSLDPSVNQITRMSYIDLDDDIVQVEFSGPGTLSLLLDPDGYAGPAVPEKYNQAVQYMKGHASIVIAGANEHTHVSVFTVGRVTAVNQALFKDSVAYDGVADIARISISSTDGKFGGIRTANAQYWDARGYTGIYAPGVTFTGPIYVGEISALGTATPVLLIGGAEGDTAVTGGDFFQDNGQPVQVSGLTKLKFQAGSDSHGRALPAQKNQGVLHQNGQNVTAQIVVNP